MDSTNYRKMEVSCVYGQVTELPETECLKTTISFARDSVGQHVNQAWAEEQAFCWSLLERLRRWQHPASALGLDGPGWPPSPALQLMLLSAESCVSIRWFQASHASRIPSKCRTEWAPVHKSSPALLVSHWLIFHRPNSITSWPKQVTESLWHGLYYYHQPKPSQHKNQPSL